MKFSSRMFLRFLKNLMEICKDIAHRLAERDGFCCSAFRDLNCCWCVNLHHQGTKNVLTTLPRILKSSAHHKVAYIKEFCLVSTHEGHTVNNFESARLTYI
jgi:hypothetical protein